jgi:hypothetical protein
MRSGRLPVESCFEGGKGELREVPAANKLGDLVFVVHPTPLQSQSSRMEVQPDGAYIS